MDSKKLRGLMEAYSEVYAPLDIFVDEGYQRDPEGAERKKTHSKQPDPSKSGFTGIGNMSIDQIRKMSARIEKENTKKEDVDIFDTVLEFLQTEGFAETLEEAKWIMANELDEEDIDEIIEAYVDYRKGKLPSGRTPQTALKSGVERAKVNASREQRAGGSFGTTATPSWERSKKAGAVGDEMDANTSFGGKVNKVVNLGRRDNAGPSVQRGEPNTARHQQAIDARAKKA